MTSVPVPSLITAVLFKADTEQAMRIAATAVVLILVFLLLASGSGGAVIRKST